MSELNIKSMWRGDHLAGQEGKIMSEEQILAYRQQQSRSFSTSMRRLTWFDIIYKTLIALVFALSFFQGNIVPIEKWVLAGVIGVSLMLIIMEYGILNKLNLIRQDVPIRESLRKKIDFHKQYYKRFVLLSSLSNPLMVLSGFIMYELIKYREIIMGTPFDSPVPYLFLMAALLIGYFSNLPFYRIRLKELEDCIKEVDENYMSTVKLSHAQKKKRNRMIIFSVLLLLGLAAVLFFIWMKT